MTNKSVLPGRKSVVLGSVFALMLGALNVNAKVSSEEADKLDWRDYQATCGLYWLGYASYRSVCG